MSLPSFHLPVTFARPRASHIPAVIIAPSFPSPPGPGPKQRRLEQWKALLSLLLGCESAPLGPLAGLYARVLPALQAQLCEACGGDSGDGGTGRGGEGTGGLLGEELLGSGGQGLLAPLRRSMATFLANLKGARGAGPETETEEVRAAAAAAAPGGGDLEAVRQAAASLERALARQLGWGPKAGASLRALGRRDGGGGGEEEDNDEDAPVIVEM